MGYNPHTQTQDEMAALAAAGHAEALKIAAHNIINAHAKAYITGLTSALKELGVDEYQDPSSHEELVELSADIIVSFAFRLPNPDEVYADELE